VWLFVELVVVYFLFVETQGASLEETAAVMDGIAVQEQLIERVARATEHESKIPVNEKVESVPNMEPRMAEE
jgi:hypothetical protein